MNTDKIRRALETAAARIGCPPGDNADADLYREIMEAIAELDKAKALTDEDIAEIAHREWKNGAKDLTPAGAKLMEIGALGALRYARDHYHLSDKPE